MQKPETLLTRDYKSKWPLSMAGDESHGLHIKFIHYKKNSRSSDSSYRILASLLGFSGSSGDSGELKAHVQSVMDTIMLPISRWQKHRYSVVGSHFFKKSQAFG